MKKLLLATSVVLLIVTSLLMGLGITAEYVMLMTTSAMLALLLLIVLVCMDHCYIWLLPCYIFVIITHGLFLFASSDIAPYMVYAEGIGLFIVLAALYPAWQRDAHPKILLGASLLMKVCLLPEILLNWALYAATKEASFLLFSLLLVMTSSIYAVLGIWDEKKLHIIKPSIAPLLCVLELAVGLDLCILIYAWVKILRWHPKVPETSGFQAKGAFAKKPGRQKAVKPNLSNDTSNEQ